ncbi:hypothetical protein [Kineococcus sp. SYSU DK018]|uniref:hypothetical protein n=1 Tax=Kineococcus sp. SYSU DK018 TaxID=3383139 RepID=UPI003D7E9343
MTSTRSVPGASDDTGGLDAELAQLEADLGPRLRRDLHHIAAGVTTADTTAPDTIAPSRPRATRRRTALLAGAGLAATLGLAAAGYGFLPPHPETAVFSGSIDGHRWWVQPFTQPDACGGTAPLWGTSTISDASNWPGKEISYGAVLYGEPVSTDRGVCAGDTAAWLGDPTKITSQLSFLSDGGEPGAATAWSVLVASDVTAVRVSINGSGGNRGDDSGAGRLTTELTVATKGLAPGDAVPRVAAFALPAGVETVRLEAVTADGRIVPDAGGDISVPSPDDLENQGS